MTRDLRAFVSRRSVSAVSRLATGAVFAGILFAGHLATAAADRTSPTTPANLRTTGATSNSVSLAWNSSTDNSGSFTYIVSELNSGQTRTVSQTTPAYTMTGLAANRAYRFRVAARDGSGNQSANSNTIAVTTPAAPPVATPANLHVTLTELNRITLAWSGSNGATGYQVMCGTLAYGTGLQTTYTVDGLNPGTSYSCAVRALGPSGFTAWSQPVEASTLIDAAAPTAPIVWGTATSPGVVRLTWSTSTDDLSSVGYNVYVNGWPARFMLPDGSAINTVEIQNLRAATAYTFTVKAYDTSGNFSAAGNALTLTTPSGTDRVPPDAPFNLHQQGPTQPSSVWLMWNGSADNVEVKAYEVYVDGAFVDEVFWDVFYGGVNTWDTIRYLTPGTTHVFTVKGRDEAGNVSPASNPLVITLSPGGPVDTVPPSAPANLWGSTSPGCGFLDLNWTPSTDNVDAYGQLTYEIYEDGAFRGIFNNEAFEASFGRHTYHVIAVDRAGNRSAPSNGIVLESPLIC